MFWSRMSSLWQVDSCPALAHKLAYSPVAFRLAKASMATCMSVSRVDDILTLVITTISIAKYHRKYHSGKKIGIAFYSR